MLISLVFLLCFCDTLGITYDVIDNMCKKFACKFNDSKIWMARTYQILSQGMKQCWINLQKQTFYMEIGKCIFTNPPSKNLLAETLEAVPADAVINITGCPVLSKDTTVFGLVIMPCPVITDIHTNKHILAFLLNDISH